MHKLYALYKDILWNKYLKIQNYHRLRFHTNDEYSKESIALLNFIWKSKNSWHVKTAVNKYINIGFLIPYRYVVLISIPSTTQLKYKYLILSYDDSRSGFVKM